MPLPVCTVGDRFEGYCLTCGGLEVQGVMVEGEPEMCIEGKPIIVSGSIGVASCGHRCFAVGQSEVWKINYKPVARIGDPVTGEINGRLISGSDFVFSD